MSLKSHCEELEARFAILAGQGLVDVKFFLAASDEATKDVACGEVNRLFKAVDSGAAYPHDFNEGFNH